MLSMDRGSNVNAWIWRKKNNDKLFKSYKPQKQRNRNNLYKGGHAPQTQNINNLIEKETTCRINNNKIFFFTL